MDITTTLFVILILLNLYDIYSTNKILSNGGRELNPILNMVIEKIGLLKALILTKSAVLSLLYYYIESVTPVILVIIVIFYAYVCVHNFKQLKK